MGSRAVGTWHTLQLFASTERCSDSGKIFCPTCPAYKSTPSLSGLKLVQNFSTYVQIYTVHVYENMQVEC